MLYLVGNKNISSLMSLLIIIAQTNVIFLMFINNRLNSITGGQIQQNWVVFGIYLSVSVYCQYQFTAPNKSQYTKHFGIEN